MHAYCWKSGRIDLGKSNPEGALHIAKGPARLLRPIIEAQCRWAYDNQTMLVPGVPEADMFGWDPVEKVGEFVDRVQLRLRRKLEQKAATHTLASR